MLAAIEDCEILNALVGVGRPVTQRDIDGKPIRHRVGPSVILQRLGDVHRSPIPVEADFKQFVHQLDLLLSLREEIPGGIDGTGGKRPAVGQGCLVGGEKGRNDEGDWPQDGRNRLRHINSDKCFEPGMWNSGMREAGSGRALTRKNHQKSCQARMVSDKYLVCNKLNQIIHPQPDSQSVSPRRCYFKT